MKVTWKVRREREEAIKEGKKGRPEEERKMNEGKEGMAGGKVRVKRGI